MTTPEPASPVADRVAPTVRPDRPVVMYQNWRSLLFLHWEIPADVLRATLPPGLELDTYGGRAFVGLVPFTMSGVRPKGLPAVPWLSYFHETNVRTYVHVEGRGPGVYFYSLEAANPVAVALARSLFHLPYHRARMTLDRGIDGTYRYRSERLWPGPRPARTDITGRPTGTAAPAAPGTLDYFFLERYLLYTSCRGKLLVGQVHHAPYPAQPAEVHGVEETLLAAAGLNRPAGPPLAHFSAGVDVEIFGLRPAPGGAGGGAPV